MKKILISGFEDFDDQHPNSSRLLIEQIDHDHKVLLPVSFERSFAILQNKIEEINPDIVLSFGVAPKRLVVSLERIAINHREARIADNDGNQPLGEKALENGADGLFSDLPLTDMAGFLKNLGVPTEISNTAGTFVCNDIMYKLLNFCKPQGILSGFIHIPSQNVVSVDKYVGKIKSLLEILELDQLEEFSGNFGTEA